MEPSPEKLLFVIPNLLRGGAEYQLYELCKSLKLNTSASFSVLVFYRRTETQSQGHLEKIEALGVPVTVLFETPPKKLNLINALRRYLKKNPPDLVQSFLEANEYMLLMGLSHSYKLCFGVRNFVNMSWQRRLLLAPFQWRVHAYIGNSQVCINHFTDQIWVSRVKAKCIYNGIDASRFQIKESRSEVRDSLTIPQEARCFVTASNMHYTCKGHSDLLEVWGKHAPHFPKDRLLLLGDGALRADLEAQCQRLGIADTVDFLGRRQDIPRILKACDVYVSPSHSEGFSNSIAEAILSGIPAVATDVGGTREIIDCRGKGVIIPVNDSEAMLKAIGKDFSPLMESSIASLRNATDLKHLSVDYMTMYQA
jgi:glycosyltransferase involved in cell wall biosynthesis